jgi:hypothetical protein
MTYQFREFATNAFFSIENEKSLEAFTKPKQTAFYTFIWTKSKPLKLIIDSVPYFFLDLVVLSE